MKIQTKLRDIPEFKTEDEERAFWATHSDLDFPHRFKPSNLDLSKLKFTKSIKIKKYNNGKKILVKIYESPKEKGK